MESRVFAVPAWFMPVACGVIGLAFLAAPGSARMPPFRGEEMRFPARSSVIDDIDDGLDALIERRGAGAGVLHWPSVHPARTLSLATRKRHPYHPVIRFRSTSSLVPISNEIPQERPSYWSSGALSGDTRSEGAGQWRKGLSAGELLALLTDFQKLSQGQPGSGSDGVGDLRSVGLRYGLAR